MMSAFPYDIPVVMFGDAEKLLKKNYTVVASSENTYWEIKDRLEKVYGLIEFENFEYFETYRKKIAIIYGNCHTYPIKQALIKSPKFNSTYGFYPLKQIQEISISNEGASLFELNVFERCKLFIHQCIWHKNIYGSEYASENLIKELPVDCQVIGIPNVYRMPRFLYPQMESYDGKILWEGLNYFPFRDRFIDEYHNKLSIREIKEMILDENLICKEDILNKRDEFFDKLIFREKEWDIKVSQFIREKLQDVQMFYEPNHPTNELIKYIVKNIFSILNISSHNVDLYSLYKMDTFEIPIYASVKKALGLNYTTVFLREFNGLKLNSEHMNLEEYIQQYIAWNFQIVV